MVGVLADVVQIVVLAARTDALLAVDGSLQLGEVGLGVHGAEEDRLELIHAGIGKQNGGILHGPLSATESRRARRDTYVMGNDRRRDDVRVRLALVEVDKGVADLLSRPFSSAHPRERGLSVHERCMRAALQSAGTEGSGRARSSRWEGKTLTRTDGSPQKRDGSRHRHTQAAFRVIFPRTACVTLALPARLPRTVRRCARSGTRCGRFRNVWSLVALGSCIDFPAPLRPGGYMPVNYAKPFCLHYECLV